jgi:hypothetical protein
MDLSHEIRLLRLVVIVSILFSLALGGALIWVIVTRNSVDHMTVHRLDIVDADGQLRLSISNRQELPDLIIDGKPLPRNGKDAGMIFFNNEGFECGGFQVSGAKTGPDPEQELSLTFDQYHGDQNLQLMYDQEGTKKTAGLRILDHPDEDIKDMVAEMDRIRGLPDGAEKESLIQAFRDKSPQRAFFGKREGLPGVWLTDNQGKERLRLYIDVSGNPHIELLDKDGQVTYLMPAVSE